MSTDEPLDTLRMHKRLEHDKEGRLVGIHWLIETLPKWWVSDQRDYDDPEITQYHLISVTDEQLKQGNLTVENNFKALADLDTLINRAHGLGMETADDWGDGGFPMLIDDPDDTHGSLCAMFDTGEYNWETFSIPVNELDLESIGESAITPWTLGAAAGAELHSFERDLAGVRLAKHWLRHSKIKTKEVSFLSWSMDGAKPEYTRLNISALVNVDDYQAFKSKS